MIVGLIPARGGSKGIPRKNLRELHQKSLLQRGIELLKSAGCDLVYVSTDDLEISNLARNWGAFVIERPEELANDLAGTDPVLLHAVDKVELKDDDILVLHQVTSPLLTVKSVGECIHTLFENPSLNSVITIRDFHPFMWKSEDSRNWDPVGHSRSHRPRRQDLGIQGCETGGCYAMRVSALKQQEGRFPFPTGGAKVSFLESLDIDTQQDLDMAEEIISGGYIN